jgi:DNA-binding transcriptional MerR regulator
MLRYYDESGLLPPEKTDPMTGYRMYTVEQIPILHRILFFRDTGFNVTETAEALSRWPHGTIDELLRKKREEISLVIQQEQEKLRKLDAALQDIDTGRISAHVNVIVKNVPAYSVLSLRRVLPNHMAEGELWHELAGIVERNQIPVSKSALNFAIYHEGDEEAAGVDIEVCTVVDELKEGREGALYRSTEQVPQMVCAMVYGPFVNIQQGYDALAVWLTAHQIYQMDGLIRQICHRGPWNENDPAAYLTEIQVPVRILQAMQNPA